MTQSSNRCPLCRGIKENGKTTFTADLGFGVVVVRHVPAQICSQCGEDWIEDAVAEKLESMVAQAPTTHAVVEVSDWDKAAD